MVNVSLISAFRRKIKLCFVSQTLFVYQTETRMTAMFNIVIHTWEFVEKGFRAQKWKGN